MPPQPRSGPTRQPGAHDPDAGRRSDGAVGVRLGWQLTWATVLTGLLLGYVAPVVDLVDRWSPSGRGPVLVLATAVALAVTVSLIGSAAGGMGRRELRPWQRFGAPGVAVLPWVISSVDRPWSLAWGLIPWTAAVLIAVDLPLRRRWGWLGGTLVALAALRLVIVWVSGGDLAAGLDLSHPREGRVVAVLAIIIPLSIVAQVWIWDVVLRLKREGDTRSELARTQERLRFAGDLHDIQGHHLQVIALKTELAQRLVGVDDVRARQQAAEANAIARQALEETRALVRGYRAVSLRSELQNSADILGSAGIDCLLDVDDARRVGGDVGSLLGTLLREATTNVLRHSRPRSVRIALGLDDLRDHRQGGTTVTFLEVINDGVVPHGSRSVDGTGLIGLRERFEARGGGLDVHAEAESFRVRGWLPTSSTATGTAVTDPTPGDDHRIAPNAEPVPSEMMRS